MLVLLSCGWLLLALLWLYSNCDCPRLVLFFLRYVAELLIVLILCCLVLRLAVDVEELSAYGYPPPLRYVRPCRVFTRSIRGRRLVVPCRWLLLLLLASTCGHSSQSSILLVWLQLAVGVEDGRTGRTARPTLWHDVRKVFLLFLWSCSSRCSCIGICTRGVCSSSRVRRACCVCICSSGSDSSGPTSTSCGAVLVPLDSLIRHGRPGDYRLSYACGHRICIVVIEKLLIVFCGCRLIWVVWVLHFIHLLLLVVTMEVDMFLILNIELSTLQIDVVDIKVILVELHMDHFLPLLIHFVFFQTLINLVHLFTNL